MTDYYKPYATPLNREQMRVNAAYFATYLLNQGWTMEAICGALGNWEAECTLNPNRPQHPSGYPTAGNGGFGLAQWTGYGIKIHWYAEQKGIVPTATDDNPAADFAFQIEYHEYECKYGLQGSGNHTWYANHGFSYAWEDYKKSTDDPRTLATAYYWQYERSGANDPGNRPEKAAAWYEYLTGIDLPDLPTDGKKRKGMSLLLLYMTTRRRSNVV